MDEEGAVIMKTFMPVIEWVAEACQMLHPQVVRPSARQMARLIADAEPKGGPVQEQEQFQRQRAVITNLFIEMRLTPPRWRDSMDETKLPLLAFIPGLGWGVISGKVADGQWKVETPQGAHTLARLPQGTVYTQVDVETLYNDPKPARALFIKALLSNRRLYAWVAVAAFFGNLLALAGSLYSMQVYDRVLPTEHASTLIVLMIGTLLAAFTEFVIKLSRQGILEYATKSMDLSLSDQIYKRLLQVRMDQFPASVGTLSSQVRGYETIRGFMSNTTMFFAIDTPFAFLFLAVILLLAGPVVAAVPFVFLIIYSVSGSSTAERLPPMHSRVTTTPTRRWVCWSKPLKTRSRSRRPVSAGCTHPAGASLRRTVSRAPCKYAVTVSLLARSPPSCSRPPISP